MWSLQPKPTQEAKDKLKKIMVSLIKNLRVGMNRISFNDYRSSQLLEDLEECHRNILEMPLPVPGAEGAGSSANEAEFNSVEAIGETATEETLQELSLPTEEQKDKDKEPSNHPLDTLDIVVDENDPIYEQVEQMQAGTWVEVLNENEEKQRCKLAAFINSANKYIFVNRTGMKIAELTRQKLAAGLKQAIISILDDAALFDRALESVITNLRSMKEA